MSPNEKAELSRALNVVDMAITFTAMNRVFEKGSKMKISDQLLKSLRKLSEISNHHDYKLIHLEFCNWFKDNISTAEKTLKNKAKKASRPASYGHAAKVFDITAKVYVHYCNLPNLNTKDMLLPVLHSAIDNPIMHFLKSRYPLIKIEARTIETLEMQEYKTLQSLIINHIEEEFNSNIFPVQYDDIMWRRLNRKENLMTN
ncbi:hypothetical protein [Pseudomonas monteilii]|uniref:hypothetical protein n=1 Tax=Pseudomonas monteilii TaxID=76759 RepID=UPI0013780D31|nr:hypothetical protein [Pseudomonas monteilii]NBB07164.1 hypothetical protein [Pseudomonas monteilii]